MFSSMERLKRKFGIVENGKIVNIVSAYDINDIKEQHEYIIEDSRCEIGDRVSSNGRLIKRVKPTPEPFTTLLPLSQDDIDKILDEITK